MKRSSRSEGANGCPERNRSSSHSSNGLAIPSTAELLKLAPFDIDSDGDGSADAWSIALELSLQPGQLKGWLP